MKKSTFCFTEKPKWTFWPTQYCQPLPRAEASEVGRRVIRRWTRRSCAEEPACWAWRRQSPAWEDALLSTHRKTATTWIWLEKLRKGEGLALRNCGWGGRSQH